MRTEKPTSAAATVARIRLQVGRAWRVVASQGPAFRWSLALGAPALLVLLGYLAAPVPTGSAFLRAGQRFSGGDILKISRALDDQHFDYRVDDQGRIEVAADRLDDVKAVLAKLDVGPRSIEELGKEALNSSPWDGPVEREQRQIKGREEILAAMIRNLDGVVSAYVTINRPRTRAGLGLRPGGASTSASASAARPTAFVWLETEGGREIRPRTVQSIQNIIVGSEPDLKHDAVTVFDQKGHHYLVAGDPKSSTLSATKAREEDLSQEILEQIDWVQGARVTVQLVPAPASVFARAPAPSPASVPTAAPTAPARSPGSSVGVNTPLELEPEPEPQPPTPPPTDPGPLTPSEDAPAPVIVASALPELKGEVARVWVRVPRSYYYSKAAPDRDPSPDRLQPIVRRTEELIREAVAHVVPPELVPRGASPDVKIDTIPDDAPERAPLRSPVAADPHRPLSWWLPAGAAGGLLLALLSTLGVRSIAGRRPATRPRRAAEPRPGGYRSDPASEPGPGPAERVRELIRLDPEAGAGVLQRWIGQGESAG